MGLLLEKSGAADKAFVAYSAYLEKYLRGEDSLLSMVQMPKGIPVATFAIGEPGAANAGLFAVAMLALTDPALARKVAAFRVKQTTAARAMKVPPEGARPAS